MFPQCRMTSCLSSHCCWCVIMPESFTTRAEAWQFYFIILSSGLTVKTQQLQTIAKKTQSLKATTVGQTDVGLDQSYKKMKKGSLTSCITDVLDSLKFFGDATSPPRAEDILDTSWLQVSSGPVLERTYFLKLGGHPESVPVFPFPYTPNCHRQYILL